MALLLSTIILIIPMITTSFARVLPVKREIYENLVESYQDYQEDNNYPDYIEKNMDYPKAPKKAAILLEKLILALQKAGEEELMTNNLQGEKEIILERPQIEKPHRKISSRSSGEQSTNLQRRGQANGSVYWRCYFNAVTCFKKK